MFLLEFIQNISEFEFTVTGSFAVFMLAASIYVLYKIVIILGKAFIDFVKDGIKYE
jgi:hypothetical protein